MKHTIFSILICLFSQVVVNGQGDKRISSMMKKTILIILLLLVYITNMNAQDSLLLEKSEDVDVLNVSEFENPRKHYPFGINAGIGTRMEDAIILYTISADYLIFPNISAEVNYGKGMDIVYKKFVLNYYTIGGKYWMSNKYSKSGFSGFIGLFYGGGYGSNILEIPIGIHYIFKAGLQTSFQLCYTYHPKLQYGVPNLEFRIGWRFKLPKKKQ